MNGMLAFHTLLMVLLALLAPFGCFDQYTREGRIRLPRCCRWVLPVSASLLSVVAVSESAKWCMVSERFWSQVPAISYLFGVGRALLATRARNRLRDLCS